jgi:hypothetical protein
MAAYCHSCFRDLPGELDSCRHCVRPVTESKSSILFGLLLFGVVMAGMLGFDARLSVAGAAVAIVGIGARIFRAVSRAR